MPESLEDVKLGFDAGRGEFAVQADGAAKQQVARAANDEGRREIRGVGAVDGGDQRVLDVVSAGIKPGGGAEDAVVGDERRVVSAFVK